MVAGVLLTGGKSSRMGSDKAMLVVDGETLAARAARVLTAVCDPVVEAGDGVTGLRAVREQPPGGGPLAALVAAADALATTAPIILLACDMPFVEAPLLELVATQPGAGTVIPIADDRLQYGCARYGARAIERARAALVRGERSYRRAFADDPEITRLDPASWQAVAPPHAFADVDTPADLERFGLDARR